jgi:hypothetical protein
VLYGKPVEISAVIRRMRGGSQSFLVRGRDGDCYVAKFANNPQGNRTLINECIASHLLSALGVSTPELAILRLSDSCRGRQELYFSTERREPVVNGLHLGSKCPVDPECVAIFDFLPRKLYAKVDNLDNVGIVFAFDQWSAHQDNRQFIFAREPNRARQPRARKDSLFTVWAIDNGLCFGQNWTVKPRRLHGSSSFFNDVFSQVDTTEFAVRGAELIQSLSTSELNAACQHIPRDWFVEGDEIALSGMLQALHARQHGFAASIHGYLAALAAKRLGKLAGKTEE